ncbi:MAG: hydroxyethylthiazole kinase [Gammaproteobacteria bacterium]
MIEAAEIGAALARVREQRPRVHCLMNTVAQKLVADGLSALGAIPSMTSGAEEIEAFVGRADALLVNLGTMQEGQQRVIGTAVELMGDRSRPVVIDPVFCDVSPLRRDFALKLIAPAMVVRGNAGEIGALGAIDAVIIQTGKIDQIQHGDRRYAVANGHHYLPLVSGTGCLSGALIAAFTAVEQDALLAAVAAQALLGIAAEVAAENSTGPGSFAPALLDALHSLDNGAIKRRLRVGHG